MKRLVIEGDSGNRIALVYQTLKKEFRIDTKQAGLEDRLRGIISETAKNGIPLRFERVSRTNKGHIRQSKGIWCKPGDPEFLEALADKLIAYDLFAYVEYMIPDARKSAGSANLKPTKESISAKIRSDRAVDSCV
ncbi:MAG: hypothetical protein HYX90_08265 [Chloroflexi bacterium]|nr:hypothetical protein [Chloroflexota bacterium]